MLVTAPNKRKKRVFFIFSAEPKPYLDLRRSEFLDDVASVVLDPQEISLKISERRRGRFLRNISPPYDRKGKWKCKNNSLKKLKKSVRKRFAARKAFFSWFCFFLLSLLLLVIVGFFSVDHNRRYSQNTILRQWFKDGFKVDESLSICGNSRNRSRSSFTFYHVSDFSGWKQWMKTVFSPLNDENLRKETEIQVQNCNTAIFSSLKMIALKPRKRSGCENLPLAMQKLLKDDEFCENKPQNSTFETEFKISFVDLSDNGENQGLKIKADELSAAIDLEFIVFNKLNSTYSLVQAIAPFSHPFRTTEVLIRSVSFDASKGMSSTWLFLIHFPLFLWTLIRGLRGILFLVNNYSWTGAQRRRRAFKNSFNLLDILLWILIVAYLFTASVFWHKTSRSAEIFEKSVHLFEDPHSILKSLIKCEVYLNRFLGLWSILVAIKLMDVAIVHHGFKSKFTRGITAVFFSMKLTFMPLLKPSILIFLVFFVMKMLNSILSYKSVAASKTCFRRLFRFWFILAGKGRDFDLDVTIDSRVYVLLYVVLLAIARTFFKGFLVASHRWYYHLFKNFPILDCFTKKREKFSRKQNEKEKRRELIYAKRGKRKLLKFCLTHSDRCQFVTFKQLFQEIFIGFRNFFSAVCSSVVFTTNRLFGCSLRGLWRCIRFQNSYQESPDSDPDGNEITNSVSFLDCDYDKTKVDEEFLASDLFKTLHSFPTHHNRYSDGCENGNKGIKNYSVPADIALSEVRDLLFFVLVFCI